MNELPMKTIRMTPEFMAELDREDPKRGLTLQMSVTTDGSDVSREEVEAQVRKWVQARKDGKCKVMNSFPEDDVPSMTVDEFLSHNAGLTKKVYRGCPNKGNMCGCLGVCQDVIDVPKTDPREEITEESP